MNIHALQAKNAQQSKTLATESVLQRKCACGNHVTAGEKCGKNHKGKLTVSAIPIQRRDDEGKDGNHTGMPSPLKAGLETLSGMDLSGVRVHTNSSKPAYINALAYTHGQDIHIGPGQEKHLPHEGWHVVQQMQGRVQPTMQGNGLPINDDEKLEREADVMGTKALQKRRVSQNSTETRAGQHLIAHELTHVVQQGDREGPVQRQHTPDTGWRYTPPATVTRSIEEIQGVVGTTPDGVYGINTKKAVIKYQTVLTAKGFYADTIDGKWGNNTDVAHEALATAPNVERLGYNCAGFAFKRFTWIDLAPTKTIYATMTKLSSCADDCPAFHHKFWMWEFDINTEDTRTGTKIPMPRDFHTVGGQTDKDGKGPNQVMSKDGGRPVMGPKPPLNWRPLAREPVVRMDGSLHPFLVWNVSSLDQDCFHNQTLP